jgi:hypothetical protein
MNDHMNTPGRSGPAGADRFVDEREWRAQERAIAEERRGEDPAALDARVAQYRLIARALRHPPLDPVPFDFAARLAAGVGAPPRSAEERFERLLLRGLLALLALSGTAVTALYGADWISAAAVALPQELVATAATATNWSVALLACVGLSWALERACRWALGADG